MAPKANTSEALQTTANKLNGRMQNLEAIRTKTRTHLEDLAANYKSESANAYHEIMFAWDVQFDKITQALATVVNAMGGSATAMDHTEEDNKQWATKLSASSDPLVLKI
jgi:WXG100 family type VII secretion target